MNATGSGQTIQGHFNKTSMQRGKRQYDHHTKLRDIQERFTLWTEDELSEANRPQKYKI